MVRSRCLVALLFVLPAWAASPASRVEVTSNGALSVVRPNGRTWRTVAPPLPPATVIRQALKPPVIDGDAADWAQVPAVAIARTMVSEGGALDAAAGAEARFQWDSENLYVCLTVRGSRLAFPAQPRLRWWDDDSAEVWLGGTQVGLSVSPGGCLASRVNDAAAGCKVAMRRTADLLLDAGFHYAADTGPAPTAYVIEAAIPWSVAAVKRPVALGSQVPLAVGVNYADAPGHRTGQIYYPATWQHSQPETFAVASLADAAGHAPATTKPAARVRDVRRQGGVLTYRQELALVGRAPVDAQVKVTTAPAGDVVEMTIDLPQHDEPFTNLAFPAPLSADLAHGWLGLAPYMDGLAVPQNSPLIANRTYGPTHDLPFVAVWDEERGDGYLLLFETPHDAQFKMTKVVGADGQARVVPQAVWLPQLGKFGEARKMRLEFVDQGGYVALAKRYRAYAERTGLLKTLRQKQQDRPQLDRLAGAPDIWGGDYAWALEAKARGIEHCLLNYTGSKKSMQRVIDQDWLVGRYDNYADLLEEKDPAKWTNTHGTLDQCYHTADGKVALGWLTWDKKQQYYERSSATAREAAERYIPGDLAKTAYNARFLDVTTASALYEDYSPNRVFNRTQDMKHRANLFSYVNSLKLVTGGEHGRFWAVPTMDYFEGMMSGNSFFSWPAGHIRKPDDGRAGISDNYRQYGLGPIHRIPLWELVFHDCAASYWYWGDSNDYLHELDPALTDRKDALNVLYGTPPMYWVNNVGFGRTEAGWQRLMQSYLHTCRWHQEVMWSEMKTHAYLTPDKLVQRTTFTGSHEAVVNFAAENRTVTVAGRSYVLPPEGFVAVGPRFLLARQVIDGRVVTKVSSPSYAAVDGGGRPVGVPGVSSSGRCIVQRVSAERLRVASHGAAAVISPTDLQPGWDLAGTRVFVLDLDGHRQRALKLTAKAGLLEVPASDDALELATGSETRAADVALNDADVTWQPAQPRQGEPLNIVAVVRNDGHTAIKGGQLTVTIDGRPAATAKLNVAAQQQAKVAVQVATTDLDGPRQLVITARAPAGQALQLVGQDTVRRRFTVALDRRRWAAQPLATPTVTNGAVAQVDAVASWPFTVPAGVALDSLRVWDPAAQQSQPAQFEPSAPGRRDGTLVWQVSGALPAGAARSFEVLGASGGVQPPAGGFWLAADKGIDTPVYQLSLVDGVIRDVVVKAAGQARRPVIDLISYSSPQTGWVAENGRLDSLDVLAQGPVRTVVRVKRTLAEGTAVYTKTYAFFADRFETETVAKPSVTSLHNRLYYGRNAKYLDSRGKTTLIDGKGDDNDRISGPPTEWIAVLGEGWAHSLTGVGQTTGVTFWDGGNMGGLGLHESVEHSRHVLVFHAAQVDASFAKTDAQQIRNPVRVKG